MRSSLGSRARRTLMNVRRSELAAGMPTGDLQLNRPDASRVGTNTSASSGNAPSLSRMIRPDSGEFCEGESSRSSFSSHCCEITRSPAETGARVHFRT